MTEELKSKFQEFLETNGLTQEEFISKILSDKGTGFVETEVDIKIPNLFFKHVLKGAGYPVVTEEEIYPLYPKEDLCELLEECLEEWQRFFPKVVQIELGGSANESVIDCPVPHCLGILHYEESSSGNDGISLGGINYQVDTGMQQMSRAILSAGRAITTTGLFTKATYGTPFRYNENELDGSLKYQQAMLSKSAENVGKDCYVFFDETTNKIHYKSAQGKTLYVDLAVYDNDISHIVHYHRKFEDYCRYKFQYEFAHPLTIMNTDLPLSFNADTMCDEAKEELEKFEQFFSENSQYALVK